MVEKSSWNVDLVSDLCIEESARAILRLKWPNNDCQDRLFWTGNSLGVFSATILNSKKNISLQAQEYGRGFGD